LASVPERKRYEFRWVLLTVWALFHPQTEECSHLYTLNLTSSTILYIIILKCNTTYFSLTLINKINLFFIIYKSNYTCT
jgi:hypothetical protein